MSETSRAERLLEVGLGYWHSKAFLTACELKLFTLVHRGKDTVEQVARTLGLPTRSTRILMDAMASLGLLAKESDRYSTTDLTSDLLVEGNASYMGDFFVAIDRMFYAPFVDFERSLKQDRPVWSFDDAGQGHRPISPEESRLLARAMHGLNRAASVSFGQRCDLSRRRHLLDIGGGSGVMSISAVQKNPSLKATVLDRPAVCGVAREYIQKAGLDGRIAAVEGDLMADNYPDSADVHLYSSIFHNFSVDVCAALLAKSFRSLPSGGEVLIIDYILDDDRTSPAFGAFFNLFALVAMDGGEARTFQEYRGWLEVAGFRQIMCARLVGPSTLVRGVKEG